MPDTMIPTEMSPALIPAHCGVMDGYRSPQIGKLVAARAKASTKIKAIIKDKKADIPNKNGGRGYQYAYADLADVLDAIEDAISEQGLAIFQTTQDRQRDGTFLVTTLAHESDQWIAAEIRLKSADAGPQVYGSEMTYLRRYAVLAALALAPEADDDGRAAQDRADQTRQKPPQRVEPPRSITTHRKPQKPASGLPSAPATPSTSPSRLTLADCASGNGWIRPKRRSTASLKNGGAGGWSCTSRRLKTFGTCDRIGQNGSKPPPSPPTCRRRRNEKDHR